jgi:phenylpyruvate tautomerase PptA (4-oxalocrotonate tautomerase family)
VNVKGVLYGIAAALPHMKAQKSGHIINVSSVAGHKVGPAGVVYAATKHAVRVNSEGLRQEVKPYNIRSTIISPGMVATELLGSITEPDIAEAMRERYEGAIPTDFFARMVAFAISQPDDVDVNEILFRPTSQDTEGESETMPHVTIKLYAGKSEQQKSRLAEEITKAVMAGAQCGEHSVSVGIEDVEPSDWVEKVYKPDIIGGSDTLYKKPGYDHYEGPGRDAPRSHRPGACLHGYRTRCRTRHAGVSERLAA